MISGRPLLVSLTLALSAPSLLAAECLPTLRLELAVDTPKPLSVTVTLRNPLRPGMEPSFCALVPGFTFELEPNTEGYLTVQFEVVAPSGKSLTPTKGTATIPVRPSLEKFRYLVPGQFFGHTLSLGDPPFGFETEAPGTYRITAKVTTAARDYFAATLKQMKGKAWSSVDPKEVFQGDLRSNTVEFVVK